MADLSLTERFQNLGAGLTEGRAGIQRLEGDRRRAMAVDFRNILGHLNEGNTDRALTLLNNRQADLARLSGDPASTEFLTTLITTGDVPQAQQFLEGIDREFVNEGTLKAAPLPKSKVVGDFLVNESTGDVLFDASGKGPKRTVKDANGFLRFVDSGKRVFPEVVKAEQQLSGKNRLDQAKSIRNEIAKENSDFTKIANSWDRISASADSPSAAGDLALIFNFMKMLDPGSTVREGEFATAANSAGVPDRLRAQYNRVFNGERLAVAQRADFLNQAQNIFNVSSERANNITEEFVRVAELGGLRREEVVIERGAAPVIGAQAPVAQQAPAAPQAQAPQAAQAPTQVMRFDAQGNLIQ